MSENLELCQIPLTQGKHALVDVEDCDLLSESNWCVKNDPGRNTCYAYRGGKYFDGKRMPKVYMHRLIVGAKKGQEVDHIDGNGLNNTKENLRVVTRKQNSYNRKKSKGKSSCYKGVAWRKDKEKWQSYIRVDRELMHLGYFSSEEEAAVAYYRAAQKHFEQFAKLNNIPREVNHGIYTIHK